MNAELADSQLIGWHVFSADPDRRRTPIMSPLDFEPESPDAGRVPRLSIRCVMNFVLQSWQLLFVILVGWVSRRQQEIIEFQNAQIAALLQLHGKKRILLNDDQRRVLAVKAKSIP